MIDDIYTISHSYVTNDEETGYCPLYITGNGGGEIRQVFSAWDYCAGPGEVIVDGTTAPLTLYSISSEHERTKPAFYLNNADNVTLKQIQTEYNYQALKAIDCDNLVIVNLYYHLLLTQMEGNEPNSFAVEFVDCTNVDMFCFWRYYDDYFDNVLRWTAGVQHEDITGSAPSTGAISAYRRY